MSKQKKEWWVRRKGDKGLGPMTHREARTTSLAIARAGDTAPQLQRVVEGRETITFRPRFPELAR